MGLGAIDYALHCDRRPRLLVITDIDDARLERAQSIYTCLLYTSVLLLWRTFLILYFFCKEFLCLITNFLIFAKGIIQCLIPVSYTHLVQRVHNYALRKLYFRQCFVIKSIVHHEVE